MRSRTLLPKEQKADSAPESTLPYFFLILLGLLVLIGSFYIPDSQSIVGKVKRLTEELGLVLVSVWGVSLFYEKFLARRHFLRFHENLRDLVRRGEMNAALCERLGILEIHANRRSYEEKHSFAREIENIGAGDFVRVTGRSLIFSMYAWRNLAQIVENGANLQLCIVDPALRDSPLNYLAGYSPDETELAIHRFVRNLKPWLENTRPKGTAEVRFHRVHILDSCLEIAGHSHSVVAWDLNFGEGTEDRRIFFIDGQGALAHNLTAGRYQLVWDHAQPQFVYKGGQIILNRLSTPQVPSNDPLSELGPHD